ncbi:MAG: hypothetical protein Q4G46_04135 [Propionibacteriaceae bacterium]|nr:hypothetical protein [Propionibacteriaceae bacterium]
MTGRVAPRPWLAVRGVRRLIGLVAAGAALVALIVTLVLAAQALYFQVTSAEAVGEVVAVHPVVDDEGTPRADRTAVVVEYPDRNGQFRRFDEQVTGNAPVKGAEVAVHYRMGPPVVARMANPWWLWRPASISSALFLGLALVAEEALRLRRRPVRPVSG